MTERERLAEMILDANIQPQGESWSETIADYLLDHGVIVPPCKVGDAVYYLGGTYHSLVRTATVKGIKIDRNGDFELYVYNGETSFAYSIDIFYFTPRRSRSRAGGKEKGMTQKRFIKLCMAEGMSRNEARGTADFIADDNKDCERLNKAAKSKGYTGRCCTISYERMAHSRCKRWFERELLKTQEGNR